MKKATFANNINIEIKSEYRVNVSVLIGAKLPFDYYVNTSKS